MPGFNHRAYAEAAINYAVKHKIDKNWEAVCSNMDIAFKHGEDTTEDVFDRVGIHMSNNVEFYMWLKSVEYLSNSERSELSCMLGIATQYQLAEDWFSKHKITSWLKSDDLKKYLDFISIEQMMFKMGLK